MHVALGAIGLAAGLALCVGVATSGDTRAADTLGWVVALFTFASVVYLLPSVIGGAGLLLGKSWGRVVVAVVSVVLLTLFPIGTPLGALSLWVLFGRRPATPGATSAAAAPASAAAPRAPARPPPVYPPSRAPGVLLAAAGVAAGFVVMIGAGFRLNHQTAPAEIDAVFVPALLVLLATITVGAIAWRRSSQRSGLSLQQRARFQRDQEMRVAEHRRRLAVLAADPMRAKYAALIESGQYWTDEQIAYDLDPAARVTCAHLRPIETAMREAGLCVKPSVAAYVNVDAVIDVAEFARRYPDPQVAYSEVEYGGRAYEDSPVAQIACTEHRSAIYATHAGEAKPDTPRFPA